MLSSSELQHIEVKLEEALGDNHHIIDQGPVSGGDINETHAITTTAGKFFLKKNSASAFPGMFEAEDKGLGLLHEHSSLNVPRVIHQFQIDDWDYLLMSFLERGSQKDDFWEDFGMKLANMHRQTQNSFGLDHSNYIGSLTQVNEARSEWESFFIEMRIEPMVKRAVDSGRIPKIDLAEFDKLFRLLQDFFPQEPSAFIHGDLWNGNYSVASDGYATIYDPAVYFGHREMDLGMSRLFGGFSPEFYESYHQTYPLESGWEQRLDVANLYPLLVHVNLFGGGYYSSAKAVIRRFTQ